MIIKIKENKWKRNEDNGTRRIAMTERTAAETDHSTFYDKGVLTGFALVVEMLEREQFTTLAELYRYLTRRCKG